LTFSSSTDSAQITALLAYCLARRSVGTSTVKF
jgi:hypothetical protein